MLLKKGPVSRDRMPLCPFPFSVIVRGDLLTSWSFAFQTREQLQADLLRCQAKIEDLEKLLVEKGQVSRNGHMTCSSLHFCPLGGVTGGLGPKGMVCQAISFALEM